MFIALDIGNVICHADMKKFIEEISATFNISIDEADRFLRSFQQMHDIGLTTMENQLRVWFDCKSEVVSNKLINSWNNAIYPNMTAILTLERLQKKGAKIALLSNIGVEHAEMAKSKLHPIYDGAIKHFSCFVGARKPTMLYYQSFLWNHPEFTGCLYVDDLVENLEASKQFGFKTMHFSLENDNIDEKYQEIESLILTDI